MKKGQRLPRLPSGVKAEGGHPGEPHQGWEGAPAVAHPPAAHRHCHALLHIWDHWVYQRALCWHMPASLLMLLAATLSSMLSLVRSSFPGAVCCGMCGVLGTDASARISQQLTKMGRAGDRHLSYLPLAHIYERVTLIGGDTRWCVCGLLQVCGHQSTQ